MNKKGVITIAIAVLIIFFSIIIILFGGSFIGGILLKNVLESIPIWAWAILGIGVFYIMFGGKN